jgi:hypothetical protein
MSSVEESNLAGLNAETEELHRYRVCKLYVCDAQLI